MTEEEFLKRWIMHYIHPEYFYIPFGGYMKLIEKIAYKNGVYLPKDEIDPETGKKYSPPAQGYSKFTVALPLDSKEVQITTSGIEESQAGIFTYNPHDEEPELEGYSLFTIDLSGVKDDIEDLQQQVSDLEDELEDCHDCRDAVVAAIQEYDPNYDPAEGECPAPKVGEIVDHAQACDDCKAEVVAKLQEYDPNFDPQTCEDIVDEIDDVYQKGRDDEEEENPPGFEFPPDVTIPEISELIAGEVTVSTPTSEWELEVFLYAKSYDGSVTKRVRTLHTGGESWFFRPAISFIHGDEEHVVMPTTYWYQIGPSASEWVSITEWSIDSSTTVSLSWINQDGNTRSWGGFYAGADLTPLMTGPYIVKNK